MVEEIQASAGGATNGFKIKDTNAMEEEEALFDLDFDDFIDIDADLDLDCEIELILCDSPTAGVIAEGTGETV